MGSQYQSEFYQNLRFGVFRFGRQFTHANIKFFARRHPFARFYAYELVHDALPDFVLIDPDTQKELDGIEELMEMAKKFYPEFKRGIGISRAHGKSYMQFYRHQSAGKTGEKLGELKFQAFDPEEYQPEYSENGILQEVEAQPYVKGHPSVAAQVWKGKQLDRGFELYHEQSKIENEGISALEPIWDILYSIYILIANSAYFIAKAGGGLKRVRIPESALESDSDLASDLAQSLSDFGSDTDVLVEPTTINGQEVEVIIESVDQRIHFQEFMEMYIWMLVSITGIPMSTWKGLVPGQLDAGKINEESYQDVLRDLRMRYDRLHRWYIDQIAEYTSTPLENYKIDFLRRQEMEEMDQMKLMQMQFTIVKQLLNMQVKKERAFQLVGYELSESDFDEPDPEEMEQAAAMQEAANGS